MQRAAYIILQRFLWKKLSSNYMEHLSILTWGSFVCSRPAVLTKSNVRTKKFLIRLNFVLCYFLYSTAFSVIMIRAIVFSDLFSYRILYVNNFDLTHCCRVDDISRFLDWVSFRFIQNLFDLHISVIDMKPFHVTFCQRGIAHVIHLIMINLFE